MCASYISRGAIQIVLLTSYKIDQWLEIKGDFYLRLLAMYSRRILRKNRERIDSSNIMSKILKESPTITSVKIPHPAGITSSVRLLYLKIL